MSRFQKISCIVLILIIISFFAGLFFGYFTVIHNQKITQNENGQYIVEFMDNEYLYN